MKLIVVESPTKARTITNYLPKVTTLATMGHIKDLPKTKLGVDVDNGFATQYKTIKGKGNRIKEIVKASKKIGDVYIATDPDREGEAIAYHIQQELPVKAKRVLFYEMTKEGINKGLSNPGKIDGNKVTSQKTRRIFDRLVGYKISPILWKIIKRDLSAGRVQSVVLRLICEREKEIEDFIVEDYWDLFAKFVHKGGEFKAKLWKVKSKLIRIKDKNQLKLIKEELEKLTFHIKEFNRKKSKSNPFPPLITSSLQREASNRLKFSPKKTMFIAQRLFEGIKIGEGQTGLITYMRTDSFRISENEIKNIRDFIRNEYGEKYLPENPNRFKSRKTAQEAHEAIRPTDIKRIPETVKEFLSNDEFRLYKLIWERTLASQFKNAIFDSRTAFVKGNGYEFKASSRNLIFPGFYKILSPPKEEEQIPLMVIGDEVKLKDLESESKRTKPKSRYSEASMVKEMETKGIGRPSTYAPTISILYDRGYVRKEEGYIIPNEIGRLVNNILISNFDSIINVKFTSELENTLDLIERGEKNWQESLNEFYKPFKENLESVEEKIAELKEDLFEMDNVKCPECGKPVIIKFGRYGKFLSCSNPDCKWTGPHPDDILDEKCPKDNGDLVIKHGKYGRFIACSNYPDCDYTKPITTGVKCPLCNKGEFIERKSKKGKIYYPCSNKDCNNVLWDKPLLISCPVCNVPFMVEKRSRKGNYFYCVKCKHKEYK
jgi:DNA topoisomerase-1